MGPRLGRCALALVTLAAGLALAACGSGSKPVPKLALVRVPADAPTIQAAADRVAPGGMILVSPGVYNETVQVTTPDVTVRGEDRNRVIIDGGGLRPYGIVGEADGIRVQNLTVRNTTFYGVLVTGLHDSNGPRANSDNGSYEKFDPAQFPPLQRFEIDHVTAYNNGLYGIYAFDAQHGSIHDNYASGSADSGFYVGQCHACDILVTGNVGERNAVGFENANASAPLYVVGNRFSNNRVGLTLLSDYQEVFIPQTGNVIAGNLISNNNEAQTPEQADGGFGTGVGISGGTQNTFVRNRIAGNSRSGVLIANTNDLASLRNTFKADVYSDNRVDFGEVSAPHTPGVGNCAEAGITTMPSPDPATQPGCHADTQGAAVTVAQMVGSNPAPPGISFLKVPAPPQLPGLADVTVMPDKVPAAPVMPAVDGIQVPAATLFQNLTLNG